MLRALIIIVMVATINVSAAADYDVLIRNGSIYDGTGAPPYIADLAINGDRISAIGQSIPGSAHLEIDASGLAVAGLFQSSQPRPPLPHHGWQGYE